MALSTWLILTRLSQMLGALGSAGMNGYLIALIYTRRLGLSQNMVVLELMASMTLVYSTLALILQQTGHRSESKPWLVSFIVLDVLFALLAVAVITILAMAGVPHDCAGLTRSTFDAGDAPNIPAEGYTTIRFSNESPGQRGELDRYCPLERGSYFVSVAIILTYKLTIIITVLQILKGRYISRKKHDRILKSMEQQLELDHKLQESRHLSLSPRPMSPSPPQSEGIMSHRPSVRDPAPSLPPRRILPTPGPGSLRYTRASTATGSTASGMFVPLALDLSDEHIMEAGLVADGFRHNRNVGVMPPGLGLGIAEERSAEDALVSDGLRHHREPSAPLLPPYSPSSSRMLGHADEGNDIRLSDYVKGGTRAQTMKDSGRY